MEYDKELATRLNMLDPDEIKKRQEELKNQKKKMKDLKIFANIVEDAAVKMINQIAENEHFDNLPIRIMPDTHAGKGIVVGFTCPMGPLFSTKYCQMNNMPSLSNVSAMRSLWARTYTNIVCLTSKISASSFARN